MAINTAEMPKANTGERLGVAGRVSQLKEAFRREPRSHLDAEGRAALRRLTPEQRRELYAIRRSTDKKLPEEQRERIAIGRFLWKNEIPASDKALGKLWVLDGIY